MATTFFLRNLGVSGARAAGKGRGTASTTKVTNTAAGPTAGVQLTESAGGAVTSWMTNCLQAVTISGTITFNIRGLESNALANAGFQVKVERCNAAGVVQSTIVNSERGTEMGTSDAANNWTASPTSTALSDGDRLKITVYANDAGGNMTSGRTVTISLDGPTAAAAGDSYVTFTENFGERILPSSIASAEALGAAVLQATNKVLPSSITSVAGLTMACGFECASISTDWNPINGPVFDSTVEGRNGTNAARIDLSGAVARYIAISTGTGGGGAPPYPAPVATTRFRVRFSALPSSNYAWFYLSTTVGNPPFGYLDNTGRMQLEVGAGGGETAPDVIAPNTWYTIEFTADAVAGTMSWSLDGVPQAAITPTGSPAVAFTSLYIGNPLGTDVGTLSIWVDDYVMSQLQSDYPIGSGHVAKNGAVEEWVPGPNAPRLQAGGVAIAPSSIASGEAVGTHILKPTNTFSVTAIDGGPPFDPYVFHPSAFDTHMGFPTIVQSTAGTIIAPTAIDSAEAVGSHTLRPGGVLIRPIAIASGEAVGNLTVQPGGVTIAPSSTTSGEAFGSLVLKAIATILPTAIASGESFGTATLLPGGVSIQPGAIASGEALGNPTVVAGTAYIQPASIASAEVVGTYTLFAGGVTVAPNSIASAEALGSPALVATAVILPTGIASAEAVGTPSLRATATILPAAIGSGETLGTPTLLPGGVLIIVNGIASDEAVPNPAVISIGGAQIIQPSGIPSAEAVGSHTLKYNQFIQPASIASGESVGNPTLQVGNGNIRPSAIGSAEVVSNPTVRPGTATIAPVGIASAEQVVSPTVLPGAVTIRPTAIGSQEALGTPNIDARAFIVPSSVGSGEAIGQPTLFARANIVVEGIATGEILGSPVLVLEDLSATVELVSIPTGEVLGSPRLIPGVALILPSSVPSDEEFGDTTVLGRRTGWIWVNRSPAMAGVRSTGRPTLQDDFGRTREGGWPQLQDGFARPRKNEGEG